MSCTHCGLCLESCPTYTLWRLRARLTPRAHRVDRGCPGAGRLRHGRDGRRTSTRCLGCMACMTRLPGGGSVSRICLRRRRRRSNATSAPAAGAAAPPDRAHSDPSHGSARPARSAPRDPALHARRRLILAAVSDCCSAAPRAPSQNRIHRATRVGARGRGLRGDRTALPSTAAERRAPGRRRDHGLRRAQADDQRLRGGRWRRPASLPAPARCGAALKDYGRLLGTPEARAFSALAVDVHELLASAPRRAASGPLALRVAYHDACQLRHGQGISDAPRSLLSAHPGFELVELPAGRGRLLRRTGHLPRDVSPRRRRRWAAARRRP